MGPKYNQIHNKLHLILLWLFIGCLQPIKFYNTKVKLHCVFQHITKQKKSTISVHINSNKEYWLKCICSRIVESILNTQNCLIVWPILILQGKVVCIEGFSLIILVIINVNLTVSRLTLCLLLVISVRCTFDETKSYASTLYCIVHNCTSWQRQIDKSFTFSWDVWTSAPGLPS